MMKPLSVAMMGLLISGCSGGREEADSHDGQTAAAETPLQSGLRGSDSRDVGTVSLIEDANGVMVRVQAIGLRPGPHAVHLHAVGRCDAPSFETAGPHWNPGGKQHGRDNPKGAHLGDLANLDVGDDGRGSSNFIVAGARLHNGQNALLDLDGAALVIHARPDDYKTDPSGASGERIACALLSG